MFRNHGEEFRSFGSEGPIRRHGERDKVGVVSLYYGMNVRVSFQYFRHQTSLIVVRWALLQ